MTRAKPIRWTSEENEFLMTHGFKTPWSDIARLVGRSEEACKAQYKKIERLRRANGTWKGI